MWTQEPVHEVMEGGCGSGSVTKCYKPFIVERQFFLRFRAATLNFFFRPSSRFSLITSIPYWLPGQSRTTCLMPSKLRKEEVNHYPSLPRKQRQQPEWPFFFQATSTLPAWLISLSSNPGLVGVVTVTVEFVAKILWFLYKSNGPRSTLCYWVYIFSHSFQIITFQKGGLSTISLAND